MRPEKTRTNVQYLVDTFLRRQSPLSYAHRRPQKVMQTIAVAGATVIATQKLPVVYNKICLVAANTVSLAHLAILASTIAEECDCQVS